MSASAPAVVVYPSRWVRADKWCAETGDSLESIQKRRKRGEWLDGRHTIVKNRRLWVNRAEADRWVESGGTAP